MADRGRTEGQLVELATSVLQTSGYHAVRFGALADAIGIKKASVYYHFPTKLDLAKRAITAYRNEMQGKLDEIDHDSIDPCEKLERYVDLYRAVIEENSNQMCPGGMLAAELVTLPSELREEAFGFFRQNEEWLTRLVMEARGPENTSAAAASDEARDILARLQGTLLLARLFGDPGRFDVLLARLRAELRP